MRKPLGMCVGCGILGSGAELETIVHWPMHSLLVGWMGECLHIICIGIGVLLLTQEVWWLEYELNLFFLYFSKACATCANGRYMA